MRAKTRYCAVGLALWAGGPVLAGDILKAPRAPRCGAGTAAVYQPGVDSRGQGVVPAEAEAPMTIDFGKTTEIIPEVHSANPSTNGARVVLNVEGLQEATSPPCASVPAGEAPASPGADGAPRDIRPLTHF